MEEIFDALKAQTAGKLLAGVAVLVVCLLASKYLTKLIDRGLKRAKNIEPTLHTFITTAMRWLLYFVSILVAANTLGIPITSFVAVFSIVGLAVSLAVQGVLSNLAGGMIILASKPFMLGDYIESDSLSGTVTDIGFLHTRLTSPDGKLIFVPNSILYTSKVINYTTLGTRRLDLTINASYDAAPEAVRAAAFEAMAGLDGIEAEPAPQVLVESYGDSAIQYTIRLWTKAAAYWDVRYALNERLYGAFRRNGVEMTYPHLNVHVK